MIRRRHFRLNDAIEERRQIIINEQKALKKKYDPAAYEKIMAQSGNVVE